MNHNNVKDYKDRDALRELREAKLEPKRRNSTSQHPTTIHNISAATTTTATTTATITALDHFAATDNNKNETKNGAGTIGTGAVQKPIKKPPVTDKEAAKQLIAEADEILRQLDHTYLFQSVYSSNTASSPSQGLSRKRHYPTFEPSEIQLGPILGAGGFSCVFQVERFHLNDDEHNNRPSGSSETETAGHHVDGTVNAVAAVSDSTGPITDKEGTLLSLIGLPEAELRDNDWQNDATAKKTSSTLSSVHEAMDHGSIKEPVEDDDSNDDDDNGGPDKSHYEVETARTFMAECVRRKGDARYALKRLYRSMSDLERARGMIDLAIEVKFLSVLWHPNIVKMRAYGAGPVLSPNFFIIMDRLYDTLEQKMVVWSETAVRHQGCCFGLGGGDPDMMKQLMLDRLIVAYDLAAAFRYMHECKLVYRDIKQANIGFDVRGDVKVFDFGLSKGLADSLKARDGKGKEVYGYNLTARTGSIPYMAPEIAECKPYDTQCDVFSFAVLLWEIVSLRSAFKGYTPHEFLVRVARGGERHSISRRCPPLTRIAIRDSWQYDPLKRPVMTRVASLIRGDLDNLTTDIKIRQRTLHMLNRSAHSAHLISVGSRRDTSNSNRSDQIQK